MPGTLNQTSQTPVQSTELDFIYQKLSDQNNRLINNIVQLENIGHKVKNTNYPIETKNSSEPQKPDGMFDEVNLQLEYYVGHNYRLEQLIEKLSKLL